jgi:hypothetical protein
VTGALRRPGPPVATAVVTRVAVAAVWAYEGLWCKVLGGDPAQRRILGAVPFLPERGAAVAAVTIGVAESVLACWVLSGWAARRCAVAQTVVLVGFNAGGLVFAREQIADPARMLLDNAVLLATVWLLATPARNGAGDG